MTHRSATTLIGEVNKIDQIITVQCSAGKPWVLAFVWKPLDMHNPTKHCVVHSAMTVYCALLSE